MTPWLWAQGHHQNQFPHLWCAAPPGFGWQRHLIERGVYADWCCAGTCHCPRRRRPQWKGVHVSESSGELTGQAWEAGDCVRRPRLTDTPTFDARC